MINDFKFSNVIFTVQELQKKFALFIFDTKKWKNRFTYPALVFSQWTPFIKSIFISRTNNNCSIQGTEKIYHPTINSRKRNLSREVFFTVSIIGVLIADEISISINKSGEPFKKCSVCSQFLSKFLNFFQGIWLFFVSNFFTKRKSHPSSFKPRKIEIAQKKPNLFFFNQRTWMNRLQKTNSLFIYGINFPGPCLFSIFSLACVNTSTKMFVKKIRDIWIGHFERNGKSPIFLERKGSFSVKNSCKIFHLITPLFIGKLHCIIRDICPQRLNARAQG